MAGTIGTKQEAIDYLTWTFFFRRLLINPRSSIKYFNLIKGSFFSLEVLLFLRKIQYTDDSSLIIVEIIKPESESECYQYSDITQTTIQIRFSSSTPNLYQSIHLHIHPFINFSMHSCIYQFMRESMHLSIHACIHASINPCVHPCIYQSMRASMHLSIHACIHASINPCMHPCIYQSMHASMHLSIHACIHASINSSVYY